MKKKLCHYKCRNCGEFLIDRFVFYPYHYLLPDAYLAILFLRQFTSSSFCVLSVHLFLYNTCVCLNIHKYLQILVEVFYTCEDTYQSWIEGECHSLFPQNHFTYVPKDKLLIGIIPGL